MVLSSILCTAPFLLCSCNLCKLILINICFDHLMQITSRNAFLEHLEELTFPNLSRSQGFPRWGAWGCPSILGFFLETPLSKPMPSMGCTPHLKIKPPHLKNKPNPLKREALFHEMIPRKSTINNNLKSS